MSILFDSSKYQPFRELETETNSSELPSTQIPMVLDMGTYQFRIGFATDTEPRYCILSCVGRNKTKDGEVKLGSMLSEQEITKASVRSPFVDGILLAVDVLQILFEYLLNKILHSKPNYFSSLIVCIPTGTPRISKDYILDSMYNGFGFKKINIIEQHTLHQSNLKSFVNVHLGNQFITISNSNNFLSRLPVGAEMLKILLLKRISANYGYLCQNIQIDFVEFLIKNLNVYKLFYKNDFQEDYAVFCQQYKNFLQRFERQNQINVETEKVEIQMKNQQQLFSQFTQHRQKFCYFIPTTISFISLFNQQQIIMKSDFAEKARSFNIHRLVTHLNYQQDETFNNCNKVQQLQILQQFVTENLTKYKKWYNAAVSKRSPEAIFDVILPTFENETDELLNYQKLKDFLTEKAEFYQWYNDIIQFQLRELGLLEQVGLNYLPLQYYYDMAFVDDHQNVVIPIMQEVVLSIESIFNLSQIGWNGQNFEDLIREAILQLGDSKIDISFSGGLANNEQLMLRIREIIQQRTPAGKTVTSQVADEWRLLTQQKDQRFLDEVEITQQLASYAE